MVISKEVIRSKEEFHVVWLMGSGDSKGLSRKAVLNQNLPDICELIIKLVPGSQESTKEKIGLYLLSLLTRGTVLVHRHQVDYLQRDVERLKELMRRKTFIQLLAENFEREQENRKVRENEKQLSTPIRCIEDIDDVNLENLPFISAELGIDADPRFITIPDSVEQWGDRSSDLERLYGSVQPYSNEGSIKQTNEDSHIEGHSSNTRSKEKRTDVVDIGDILTTQTAEIDASKKRPAKTTSASLVDEQQLGENRNPEPIANVLPLNEPRIVPDLDFDYEMLHRVQEPNAEQQAHRPSAIDDFGDVPPQEQSKFAGFFHSVGLMRDDETILPPMPNDRNQENCSPPPAKQARVDAGEEINRENPRRNISSRPITPLNQTTLLQSTVRTDNQSMTEDDVTRREPPVEQESPQLVLPTLDIPSRRRRRRLRQNFLIEDVATQIDEAIRDTLEADWTTLVRRRDDVILVTPPTTIVNVVGLMNDPRPTFSVGRSLPNDVLGLFKSRIFKQSNEEESEASDEEESEESDEEEDVKAPEAYGFIRLLESPNRSNLINQRDVFDEEYKPIPAEESNNNHSDNVLLEKTMEVGAQPTGDHLTEFTERSKYWFTNLLPDTPHRENIVQLIDELDLLPLPDQNRVIDDFDVPIQVDRTDDKLENARHRQKSSIGVPQPALDDVEFDSLVLESRDKREKDRFYEAMDVKDEDLFFFTSGSLLLNNKELINKKLISEAEKQYPGWLDFEEFTKSYNYKDATTAFDALLLNLKNRKILATQDKPFDKILIQHVPQGEDW